MINKISLAGIAALGFAAAAPALAQTAPAQSAPVNVSPSTGPNPNQIVCEKQEVVGSRLATQRICKTRAQWAEERREDRSEVERIQTQRGCTKDGC